MMTGLVRKYYLNDTIYSSIVTVYKSLIYEYAQVLSRDMGINLNQPQLQADVEAVYLFEQKIAEILVPGIDLGDVDSEGGNNFTLDELEKQLNFVRFWLAKERERCIYF